ncbi:VOC family protein [Paenibacillus agricola]|uniref:Glyoxalase/bleomycin resistance/dioxygenase family protein n=1 Tax=Paenibacillus agricola TaxID=2716264 RepID=A0ABX0J5G0_9BACL|nr:glyoxalase/bleomycin resistance/dioxygenase family protein [Paenibacillus agricola]NHN31565.1 glyoxalase/bleomycin resistance/dioxygenase family protein [Paenibacillus agricola]
MITHFAGLQLNTVSKQAIKQFYQGQLQFPVVSESDHEISFQPTEHFTLSFTEVNEPLSPAHIAFEVPFSEFDCSVDALRNAGVCLLRWPDSREIDEFETGKNIYFRDSDGNLLEIIAHHYIKEGILPPRGVLKVMYLREIGLPVEDVVGFREWLKSTLQLQTIKETDTFNFVISGTAHAIVTSIHRRWVPIAMMALPPRMVVSFGVSDQRFIEHVRTLLEKQGIEHMLDDLECTEGALHFAFNGYHFRLVPTQFAQTLPAMLNLPLSRAKDAFSNN